MPPWVGRTACVVTTIFPAQRGILASQHHCYTLKPRWIRAQDGGGNGWVTLAGGWCWAIPQHATDPEISASFIEYLLTTENSVQRAIDDNHITVRADVAEVEEYQTYSPTAEFFTELLEGAYYRPAYAEYPEVSSAIQEAMETVMTMSATPEQAAAAYDQAVTETVGDENVQEGSS